MCGIHVCQLGWQGYHPARPLSSKASSGGVLMVWYCPDGGPLVQQGGNITISLACRGVPPGVLLVRQGGSVVTILAVGCRPEGPLSFEARNSTTPAAMYCSVVGPHHSRVMFHCTALTPPAPSVASSVHRVPLIQATPPETAIVLECGLGTLDGSLATEKGLDTVLRALQAFTVKSRG